MRFITLFKLALLTVTLSWFCFQPVTTSGQQMIDTPSGDQPATPPQPLPSTTNPFATQTETSQSNPAPVPVNRDDPGDGDDGDLGIGKFGSFPVHASASVVGGYDDDVITKLGGGHSSTYVNPRLDITYQFMDPRTEADLKSGVGFNYYFDEPGDQAYDISISLGLSIVHKATPRLTFSAVTYLTYQTEPDFAVNVGNRRSGNYFYTTDQFTANYQWLPRFATATSYSLFFLNYDDDIIGRTQDRSEHTFGNEFRFALWPSTTLLADVRYQILVHTQPPTLFSPQDSTSEYLLTGFEHTFNPRLNVSVRGGAQLRSYDSGQDRTEPYAETSLSYAAGKRTQFNWTNHYGLEEPDIGTNQARTTFRTGLGASYSFTSRFSSSVSLYYVHDDYKQGPPIIIPPFIIPGAPPFTEDSVDVTISGRYQVNRDFSATAGYTHTQVFSDMPFRGYARNRLFAGLTFAF